MLTLVGCHRDYQETQVGLDNYEVVAGVHLSMIAAEPLIEAPVDISFDDQGRLWVLEMRGFMRSLAGTGEEHPVGRIVILNDRDGDGLADQEVVFLDGLRLARALSHAYGGLLYAEPPNLWFVEIGSNLKPGKKELVDSAYAVGGNVEHQPNGLLMNIDNWIYNAKSTKRYRRIAGEWQIETTAFRGQWGITRDPFGRLIYNDNSTQLIGDYVLPNVLNKNRGFRSKFAIGRRIVNDQRVYPLRPTPVNRGYLDGVLDEEGRLKHVTSACGPVYFEGTGLPPEFRGNAFVCVPEANLIKRNILTSQDFVIQGVQAWSDREFVASSELGFRPVNLKNGPDGALYVMDMHRGIIQHKTYMTSYLRQKYIETGLDSLTGMGRILRLASPDNNYRKVNLARLVSRDLMDSLGSHNIHVRDRAQQLIIRRADVPVDSLLKRLHVSDNEITRIHALYCLEGIGQTGAIDLDLQTIQEYPMLTAHCLMLAADGKLTLSGLADPAALADSTIAYYTMYYAAATGDAHLIGELFERYQGADWIAEPILSAYSDSIDLVMDGDLRRQLLEVRQRAAARPGSAESMADERGLTPGLHLYRKHCAACHGQDGEGLAALGPPLLDSEYVAGDPGRLVDIIMYGLEGPITVSGVEYSFAAVMPGLKDNPEVSDDDIRYIANYIRNAFVTAPMIPPGELIRSIRGRDREGTRLFTVEELNALYNE